MAQTYKKTSPCPACRGYNGAYRKENRCKGFISDYGRVYCSNTPTTTPLELFGGSVVVYLQEESEALIENAPTVREVQSGTSKATSVAEVASGDSARGMLTPLSPSTTSTNDTPKSNIPKSKKLYTNFTDNLEDSVLVGEYQDGIELRKELREYKDQTSEEWFVVYRTGEEGRYEVTRSKTLLPLKGWLKRKE